MTKVIKNIFIIYFTEEANSSDATNSPLASNRNLAQTTTATSPIGSIESATSDPWPSQSDEDIDRLVANYQGRQNSLCSLGVSLVAFRLWHQKKSWEFCFFL